MIVVFQAKLEEYANDSEKFDRKFRAIVKLREIDCKNASKRSRLKKTKEQK